MRWEPLEGRTNNQDCMADTKKARYTIRRTSGRKVDAAYIVRRDGRELGREVTVAKAREVAERYEAAIPGDHKQEGKAYVAQAIKLAMMEIEVHDEQHGNTSPLDESYEYLQCALDVLEGRVPRLAVLPEIKS